MCQRKSTLSLFLNCRLTAEYLYILCMCAVCSSVFMCRGQRMRSGIFLSHSLVFFIFWDRISHQNLNSLFKLDCLAREWGYRHVFPLLAFYIGSGGLNSGPHAPTQALYSFRNRLESWGFWKGSLGWYHCCGQWQWSLTTMTTETDFFSPLVQWVQIHGSIDVSLPYAYPSARWTLSHNI